MEAATLDTSIFVVVSEGSEVEDFGEKLMNCFKGYKTIH